MMALIVGALIAVAALAYVLYPVFRGARSTRPAVAAIDDEIEAAVRAYREKKHDRCAACGTPVVARDALYCSNCGKQLPA